MRHGSVQSDKGESLFLHQRLDDGQEGGELRDNDHLVIRMISMDPCHLLDDSIHFAAGNIHMNVRHGCSCCRGDVIIILIIASRCNSKIVKKFTG